MLKIRLKRDLRKHILRGHPWVYREALETSSYKGEACLCQLLDKKGQFLAWSIYSPEGPLAIRVISTEQKPPSKKFYDYKLKRALELRSQLIEVGTNCFRLLNGEGDGLPGFVCDIYNQVAVIQFDGKACFEFWDQDWIASWLLENTQVKSVYFKPRFSDKLAPNQWGQALQEELVEVSENGVKFLVNFMEGQKTGFFLDQRDNRQYLGTLAKGRSVLNLFSYTGGFSLYAGVEKASAVTSVDIAPAAIKMAEKNWQMNDLNPDNHEGVVADVFDFVKSSTQKYDIVMVDPPSMTHSEKTKASAKKSYTDLFIQAARLVNKGQHLVLSSCSSHISFDDFLEIIDESLSGARKTGQIIRVSGQGIDHPIPHYCRELRYLKFVHLRLD